MKQNIIEPKLTNENKMGTMSIFPLVINMSLPPMTSMFIQWTYNVVDSMFVARISQEALAAVSLAFPIQNLILSVAVGAGVGCNSLIARKLGQKDFDGANNIVSHSLIFSVFISVLFILLGLLFIEPFFHMFTDSEEVFSMGVQYANIVTIISFGQIIHVMIQKIVQATGKMIYPMMFQIAGALVNLVLDPILIFGLLGAPAMGVRGAAIATVIGQIVSLIMAFYVLLFVKIDVRIKIRGFRFYPKLFWDIFMAGFPSLVMNILGSVLVMFINFILVPFGTVAIAMFGVYFKLQSMLFMTVNGLIQGVMPIMGYNFGAQNRQRLRETLRASIIISAVIMLFGTALCWIFPKQALLMFAASDEMLGIGVVCLRIISTSFVFAAFGLMFASFFQATARVGYSLLISLLRQVIILLPLAYFLSMRFQLIGAWIAFPLAEITAAIIASILFIKKEMKRNAEI